MPRYTLALGALALLAFTACDDPRVDQLVKDNADLKAQLEALQQQVGQQPDTTGMVASLQSQIADLKTQLGAVQAPKVPHWIANAGTAQEADLGPFVDGYVYSYDLGAYVRITQPVLMGWSNADCTGAPLTGGLSPGDVLFIGPRGTIVRINDDSQPMRSTMSGNECQELESPHTGMTYSDTGIVAPDLGETRTFELR